MNRFMWIACLACFGAGIILLTVFGPTHRPDLWFTANQRADYLFQQKRYAEVTKTTNDPAWQGSADYRMGDFKQASTAFARAGTAEGAYNRGNALVMQGKYADAVKSYDRALSLRPNWKDAKENRAIAIIRRDRLDFKGGDATGGKEKADDIVFGKGQKQQGEEVQVTGGDPLSDDELRSLWLRRVQTKPADFLRAKFAFQLQQREGGAK